MSIKLIEPNKYETGFMHKRQEEFLIDADADLVLLPKDTQAGSVAWLADMSKSWKMTPSGEWAEIIRENKEEGFSGSWNDLEDKPFDETISLTMIYSKDALTSGPADEATGEYADKYGCLKASSIIPGETYTVTVDGVNYTGVAEWCEDTSSDGNNGVRLFNNGEFPYDYSDAPIDIGTYSNVIYVKFDDDGYTKHSVSIYHHESAVKLIDSKFLPKATSIPDATEDTIVAQFNSLLSSLRTAGYLAN